MTVSWVFDRVSGWGDFISRVTTDGSKYICAALLAFGVSYLLTPVFREFARKIGMVDKPDPRRINKVPIPRGGGAAVILSVLAVLWIFVLFQGGKPIDAVFSLGWLRTYTICAFILMVVGFEDDRNGLNALIKLAGQVGVASIFFFSGIRWGQLFVAFPLWFDYFFTVFWIVGAINAFNLIDGLDGLASGLAVIAAFGLAGGVFFNGRTSETIPYLVFAGACLGFLRFNFNPASVFLGDTGSMFLGMTLATLPLMTGSRRELAISIGMPLLVMGVPIFDTFLAIWRRTVRAFLPKKVVASITNQGGGVLMQPDKDHLHHRLLRMLMNNQREVAWTLYGISVLLVLLALGGSFLKGVRASGLFLIAFVVVIFVVVRHFNCVELWDTGRLLTLNRHNRLQGILLPLEIGVDIVLLNVIWIFSYYFVFAKLPARQELLDWMPIFVVPMLVAMAVARTYRRVWRQARARDFIALGFAVFSGACIGIGLFLIFHEHRTSLVRLTVLYGLLTLLALGLARLWREFVTGLLDMLERRVLLEKAATPRILVYGGGMTLRGFLREKNDRETENRRMILGVLDDDPNLRGRIVAGYPVFGGEADLEQVVKEQRINGAVITCVMDLTHQDDVVRRFKACGVKNVSLWRSTEFQL